VSRDVPVVGDDGRRKLLEREVAAPVGWALPSAEKYCARREESPTVCCRVERGRDCAISALHGILGYLEGG
jgi:hypothetical protein